MEGFNLSKYTFCSPENVTFLAVIAFALQHLILLK